jgi:hypothetical protein
MALGSSATSASASRSTRSSSSSEDVIDRDELQATCLLLKSVHDPISEVTGVVRQRHDDLALVPELPVQQSTLRNPIRQANPNDKSVCHQTPLGNLVA